MHPRALKDLRNLFDELCDSYEELQERVDILEAEVSGLTERLEESEETVKRFHDLIAELQENLEIADNRIEDLEAQVEELT